MKYVEAIAWLESHINLEGSKHGPASILPTAGVVDGLNLDAMWELMGALGDPQNAYKSFHLTGTNGKGSTARFITSIVAEMGLSVGLYTSPNLEKINERILWDGQDIPDQEFADVLTLISQVVPTLDNQPSRFELLTAAALTWFAEKGVDIAVVEVGLLGRFDATNVVNGDVVVVTNIGKDHTDGVGNWEVAVAKEKAGIIKPDSHVILGSPFGSLRSIIEEEQPNLTIWEAEEDFEVMEDRIAVGGHSVSIRTPGTTLEDVFLPLHGTYQPHNLATAVAAVEAFFAGPTTHEILEDALPKVELGGRFEVISREPTVILEGAHNPDGARLAKETLDLEFARFGSWILVVGFLNGKDPEEMLEAIGAHDFDAVIVCEPTWSRAIPAAVAGDIAKKMGLPVEIIPNPVEAFQRAKAVTADDDLILVTGSLYVVGEVRSTARATDTE